MSWVLEAPGGVVLNIRAVPGASKNEPAGLMGDSLRIRLQAPPVEGKANAALLRFLAERLDVPKSAVSLLSGAGCRTKRVLVSGITAGGARERLGVA